MKYFSDTSNPEQNNRKTYQALIITLAGNLILALSKLYVAHVSGSSALQADAYNSLSDVLYSVTLVIGMMIAIRPADISHPQGHRRFEPLVGLLISFSMAWAGYQAISESIDKIRSGPTTFDLGLPILVLFFSAVIKGVMYWLIHRIATDLSSPTLKTAATDNLMDTITSFTAIIGIYLSSIWSPLADPIAGILVSVWIFRAAFEALQENLGFLTGAGASEERRQQFLDIIRSVPGVANVHQLFAEHVGSTFVLDVHINVDGNTPLYQVHRIETEIEEKLTAIPDVERAYIHVEPLGYE